MPRAMKVTTLRLGTDLYDLLEHEAELAGVSVSQYIREAALARAAAASGARGESPFEKLVRGIRETAESMPMPADRRHQIDLALAALARAFAQDQCESARALRVQTELTTRHSEDVRRALRRARQSPADGLPHSTSRTDMNDPAIAPAPPSRPNTRAT
jgi:uncharacterized protein (DUF1778 family)